MDDARTKPDECSDGDHGDGDDEADDSSEDFPDRAEAPRVHQSLDGNRECRRCVVNRKRREGEHQQHSRDRRPREGERPHE